jgi:FkbM family methyltransferase
MSRSLRLYGWIEALLGRRMVWRIGRWLYLGSRRELLNDPDWNGEYALQGWMLSTLEQPGIFMDVGANIGDWTASLLEKAARAGRAGLLVHAFEPAPAQRDILKSRLPADGKRLTVDPRGCGASSGSFHFRVTGEATGTSSLVPANRSEAGDMEVEVTTIDMVAAERGYSYIDFVKVDTEGNDFNVILGARALFDGEKIGVLQFEYNWRWIEFGHWLKEVFDFLEGRPYLLGRLTQEGIEVYEDWHPELDRYIETNFVILHLQYRARLPVRLVAFDTSNVPVRRA